MRNIEIEARSFIDRTEYRNLLKKLRKKARFLDFINEETIYFKLKKGDLRLRKDKKEAFLIFKEGKIHDESREEIVISLNISDFQKARRLFQRLGYKEEIRWFRKRIVFQWSDIKVFLDDTKGYGLIIELEKIGTARNKKRIHKELENKLRNLGIRITSKKIFEEKFKYYKNNWQKILKLKTCT